MIDVDDILRKLINDYGLPAVGQFIQALVNKLLGGITPEMVEAELQKLLPVPPKSDGTV